MNDFNPFCKVKKMQKFINIFIIIILMISFMCTYKFISSQTTIISSINWPYNDMKYFEIKKSKIMSLKIAIIDSGIDITQPCFNGINIVNVDLTKNNNRKDIHGTMIGGIICNSILLHIKNEKIMESIKFYSYDVGEDNKIDNELLIRGIENAIEIEADIINLSVGTYNDFEELKSKINEAIKKGIIVVCSAGNDFSNRYLYPASYNEVISVSSIDMGNEFLYSNNINDQIVVCAPGEKIETYISDAAIIKCVNPQISNYEFLDMLKANSIDLGKKGKDSYYGYGLINFKNMYLSSNNFFYRYYNKILRSLNGRN